ncbi:FtsX-like permease family protein [Streptomyces sp. NPDC002054]|uniref:FtsX-like permease family protein n=1 Tax=Streptomyces sp. NPDC002054 TaxID=3154663 RepID=UPI00332E1600
MSLLKVWGRDLGMGARFALAGGREGLLRTLLTGVGVGLGVALLLVTASLPNAFGQRDARTFARETAFTGPEGTLSKGPDTLLIADVNQTYRTYGVDGRLIEPEGPKAPLPPGLKAFPKPGELVVSPALDRLMKTGEGKLLRERLDGPIVATIGKAGLVGPGDLFFYIGAEGLKDAPGLPIHRVDSFGSAVESPPLDPVLTLLVLLVFVALLMPVAVFIAAAVRFGGDRRDRRLAALRLVGADGRMVRRIAGGEALAGSLVGLVLGAGLFLLARGLVEQVEFSQRSVFGSDLEPTLWLAALVVVAVPAAAVGVTLFALRGVVIEPLGVVRTATPRKRRIWWRLLLPVAGLGLLAPLMGRGNEAGYFNEWQVGGGVVLLLIGITALLPWLLERIVGRLGGGGGGGVSWQLAVRRLQLTSGTAARLVNGIAVAVAGAIALQMLFAGVENDYTEDTGHDPSRASLSVMTRAPIDQVDELGAALGKAKGVTQAVPLAGTAAAHQPTTPGNAISVTVGSCTALAEVATLPSCRDGDVFLLGGPTPEERAKAGDKLFVGNIYGHPDAPAPGVWTVPAAARPATARPSPLGNLQTGLLVTHAAAPKGDSSLGYSHVYVKIDPKVPDALDRARNAAFKADPMAVAMTMQQRATTPRFSSIRTGLFVGAAAVLVLIGASLLVSQLEQLRERRKLLSALVAFGTKRSTLSLSVLWQTALPIGLGVGLAIAVGLTLGTVLMRMTNVPVRIDWSSVAAMSGIGAGVALLVTLLSLPPLLRMMRPDGLRTE